jgi:hypothetical protein
MARILLNKRARESCVFLINGLLDQNKDHKKVVEFYKKTFLSFLQMATDQALLDILNCLNELVLKDENGQESKN